MSVAAIGVGRRKEPILGFIPENDEKMFVHKVLNKLNLLVKMIIRPTFDE